MRIVRNLKSSDKPHALECYNNFKHDINLMLYWLICLTFFQDAQ